ncbi:hypothetical protein OCUBac02_41570 [Bosea sp. ANAM02]|nr:hypothetical protein OCUBac02_41570 [Bosea sp. ANAM02]
MVGAEMIVTGSMAAGRSEGERRGERGMMVVLALFLGVIQIGWLGLLLWLIHQVVGAI